jgi:hypothetical protein
MALALRLVRNEIIIIIIIMPQRKAKCRMQRSNATPPTRYESMT